MKMLTQEEAKRICDKVMSLSKADECRVQISGNRNGNIRYARNAVSTAGLTENTQLTVSVAFGKRQGTASINEFDDKALERAVRRAEDVARLAPENPEFTAAPGKQEFKGSNTQEFWNACAGLCDERDWRMGGSFFDGKGQPSQVSAVSHGSPTTRFNGINVINTARKIG